MSGEEGKEDKEYSKAAQIADGVKNLLKSQLGLSSELDEAVFTARRTICDACEERTALNNCAICGCPFATKTRSLITNCPKGKW